ncbi:MAG: hypothetical protein KGQ46_10710 [Hyphomicrobiales bacterium]|nr:hypothetical protein [Hyphomicrobiales bacterium]MDE2114867.1 hypothetical protein [Hyphomicrobiales bacterium]
MIENNAYRVAGLIGLALLDGAAYFWEIGAHQTSDNLFIALTLLQAGIALAATQMAKVQPRATTVGIIFVAAVAFRLIAIWSPPLLSDDIYRYIWDGRLINHGFNPYLHVPADPSLAFLRDGLIYPHIDKRDYAVTIYPPVAEAIFALISRISDSLMAFKLAMVGFEAIGIAALWVMLKQLGKSPLLITAYLWHPAPVWEIANGGHVDAIMMGLLLVAFALSAKVFRPYLSGALMALAALSKPWGALWLATLWKPWDIKLPLFVLAFAALWYLPFVSAGSGVLGFLSTYLHEQGLDSGYGFFLVGLARRMGASPGVLWLYLGAGGAILLWLAIFPAFAPNRSLAMRLFHAQWLTITFLWLLTPVYPWYFLLAAPFVALQGSWSAFAMLTSGFWLYTFNPDALDFNIRWGASLAVITLCAFVDFIGNRQFTKVFS